MPAIIWRVSSPSETSSLTNFPEPGTRSADKIFATRKSIFLNSSYEIIVRPRRIELRASSMSTTRSTTELWAQTLTFQNNSYPFHGHKSVSPDNRQPYRNPEKDWEGLDKNFGSFVHLIWSIFAAMMKSFSERPPMACVQRFSITLLYKSAKSG